MRQTWTLPAVTEAELATLAGLVAFALKPGDAVTLAGNLGAGKTTLARGLIRALLADPQAEVPSPTFSLVQTYETPRFPLAHADLYRLSDAAELAELGLEETLTAGVILVEWPERAHLELPPARLAISLAEAGDAETRSVSFYAAGDWPQRLARIEASWALILAAGWAGALVHYLQGDASPRRYARLLHQATLGKAGTSSALLMDAPRMPDGPPVRDGLPYSRIAHLAEDVLPFVAVANDLRGGGLSTPAIFAQDLDRGLLLIEDLGDRVFGGEIAQGTDQSMLWRAATDALLALRRVPVRERMAVGNASHSLPFYDRRAMAIETELLLDWYWPALLGTPPPAAARDAFASAWNEVFERLVALPTGWVLRDYHSPNLIWLPDRPAPRNVGIIDFQDAMRGHAAYDLVSLLQDARLDVPPAIETEMLDHYCRTATAADQDFSDPDFRFAYAALGAQRNTKILGIFARLARRDGKPGYLRHIPRIWGYLARDLASPDLVALRAWYDQHLPEELRGRSLA
jgi:tRNA threonylcarbamoyl adenosine modification protein YjeE